MRKIKLQKIVGEWNGHLEILSPPQGMKRICSSNETYKLRCNVLTQYLNRRGYNIGFLNQKIQRVHTITCTDALKPSDAITDLSTRIPLVAGYNPALPSLSSIFHKHIHILSSFQRCATVFKSIPVVPFRSTNKPEVRDSPKIVENGRYRRPS